MAAEHLLFCMSFIGLDLKNIRRRGLEPGADDDQKALVMSMALPFREKAGT
jgi:hypothetical protein